jgi:probable rRNA maturation factor
VSVAVEVVTWPGLEQVRGPVRDLVKAVLEAEGCPGAVVVAFLDEEGISELNGRFCGLSQPTDVLSFRQADTDFEWPDPTGESHRDLGEVVVCPAVVRRYALEEGGDPETQLGWTLVHGALHLVGYDHERDGGEMRAREQALLKELDLRVRAVAVAAAGADAAADTQG